MSSTSTVVCPVYQTFGDCKYGPGKCDSQHTGEVPYTQEYFFARLCDDPAQRIWVTFLQSGESEEFRIPNGKWFRGAAKQGDVVFFQASGKEWKEQTSPPIRHGRVVSIFQAASNFRDNEAMWTDLSSISLSSPKSVYTLHPVGTYRFDHAYSVDNCREHSDCNKIGIHVSCGALKNPFKIDVKDLPPQNSKWSCSYINDFNLKEQRLALTLSVYAHSKNEDVTEPKVCLVKVQKNFMYGDGEHNEEFKRNHFNILWTRFVENEMGQKCTPDRRLQKYLTLSSASWKEYYLVDKMMHFFKLAIKRHYQPSPMFITQVWNENTSGSSKETPITIFEDLFTTTGEIAGERDKFLAVKATGLRFKESQESESCLFPKYRWSARSFNSSANEDHDVVPCTAPLINIFHYVNHQIMLRHLLDPERPCYTRGELLGMIGIRFDTPRLQTALVRKLGSDAFQLEYPGLLNTPEAIYEASYSTFTHEDLSGHDGKAQIRILGISCQENEYCNRAIVYLDHGKFSRLLDEDTGVDLGELKANCDKQSPYAKAADGTTLTLQAGIELQMQISMKDAERNHPLKWRLLRIGKKRHICFTHLNNPELAFKSKRDDVQKLVTLQGMQDLIHAGRSQRQGISMYDITINFNDAYFSGGSFDLRVSQAHVGKGSLLCIRKEIGVEPKYIWSCHGVVSAKEGDKVEFEVCTLSQIEGIEEDGRDVRCAHDCCVEVINTGKSDDQEKEERDGGKKEE